MLNNDLEQRMKEKLLEGLIEHMGDRMGDRLKPPAPLGVSVEADDPESLTDGLDKAKDVLKGGKLPEMASGDEDLEHGASAGSDPESDEDRLLQLLEEDEDEEDKR